MDKQATLDRVIAFLHAQGGPGRQHNGCFYRTDDGRRSALGCLIPDAVYTDDLEDRDPADLPRRVFDALDAESDDEIAFLIALETAHDEAARQLDGAEFLSLWAKAVERIARQHSLTLSAIGTLRS